MVLPSVHRRERGSVSQSPTPTDSVLAGDGGSIRPQRSPHCLIDDSAEIKVCAQKQRAGPLMALIFTTCRIPSADRKRMLRIVVAATTACSTPALLFADLVLSDAPSF